MTYFIKKKYLVKKHQRVSSLKVFLLHFIIRICSWAQSSWISRQKPAWHWSYQIFLLKKGLLKNIIIKQARWTLIVTWCCCYLFTFSFLQAIKYIKEQKKEQKNSPSYNNERPWIHIYIFSHNYAYWHESQKQNKTQNFPIYANYIIIPPFLKQIGRCNLRMALDFFSSVYYINQIRRRIIIIMLRDGHYRFPNNKKPLAEQEKKHPSPYFSFFYMRKRSKNETAPEWPQHWTLS